MADKFALMLISASITDARNSSRGIIGRLTDEEFFRRLTEYCTRCVARGMVQVYRKDDFNLTLQTAAFLARTPRLQVQILGSTHSLLVFRGRGPLRTLKHVREQSRLFTAEGLVLCPQFTAPFHNLEEVAKAIYRAFGENLLINIFGEAEVRRILSR